MRAMQIPNHRALSHHLQTSGQPRKADLQRTGERQIPVPTGHPDAEDQTGFSASRSPEFEGQPLQLSVCIRGSITSPCLSYLAARVPLQIYNKYH